MMGPNDLSLRSPSYTFLPAICTFSEVAEGATRRYTGARVPYFQWGEEQGQYKIL